MELENHTHVPALLYRAALENNRFVASIMARVTYDILATGDLRVSPDQVWQASPGPWKSDYGPMDGDEVFYRGGVDVMIFGSARAPGGQPISHMNLAIQVGEAFEYRLNITGDRVWQADGERLVASAPEPFTEMPLSLANAYGGKDEWDKLQISFPANPDGKGYAIDAQSAIGKPLPNIEDPRHLVANWDDQPDPVGVGATTLVFGPRLQRGVVFDDETHEIARITPRLYNSAFPDMVVPGPVCAGDRVQVDGVRHEGSLRFIVPACPLRFRLTFGDEVIDRALAVDQIGIEPDVQRAFVAWRYPFRYRLIPEQQRCAELLAADNNKH
ncbi:MAG: DUF2169 domain-containing protein [Salinisphaera sp.]|nr:DUF2169 domain-containing protein [Salinisphaera sp.]